MHHQPPRQAGERSGERGASAIEYALLLALIAVVVFSAVTLFGAKAGGGFERSRKCIQAAHDGQPIPAECK